MASIWLVWACGIHALAMLDRNIEPAGAQDRPHWVNEGMPSLAKRPARDET